MTNNHDQRWAIAIVASILIWFGGKTVLTSDLVIKLQSGQIAEIGRSKAEDAEVRENAKENREDIRQLRRDDREDYAALKVLEAMYKCIHERDQ